MTPADRIRSDADELPHPDAVSLAHAAAEAISQLCATLDACALEVQARGGQRTARAHLLPLARAEAWKALDAVCGTLPRSHPARLEVIGITGAIVGGYVRPWMALRVVTLATEASR